MLMKKSSKSGIFVVGTDILIKGNTSSNARGDSSSL